MKKGNFLAFIFASFFCFMYGSVVNPSSASDKQSNHPAEHAPAVEDDIVPFEGESPLLAVRQGKRTRTLQIASIFHHKAKTRPDFKKWTLNSPNYLDAKEIDKEQVYTKTYNRFVRAFHELEPDMIINVQSKIKLGEYSTLQSIQVFDEFHDKTYFRYDAYGEYFALIPHDIKRFHHIMMSPERRQKLLEDNGNSETVMVELLMRLIKVDHNEPSFLEEDVPFWLMLGDIAELRLWSTHDKDPKLLWRYQADWYEGYIDPELMRLYGGQKQQP